MTGTEDNGFKQVVAAIGNYLSVLCDSPEGDEGATVRLIEALDGLTATYHATDDVEPSGADFEYPTLDSRGGPTRPAAVFEKLGLYAAVEPDRGLDQEVSLHDPYNDLSEIADDMKLVLWLAENVGESDAVWEFRFGFFTHWGRHLFSVRPYLQAYLDWPLRSA
jgi:hypothetical protein